MKIIDLTGKKFGRLTIINYNGSSKWLCLCDCGIEKIILGDSIRSLKTKSCGCYNRDPISKASTTHGLYHHPIYKIWISMHERCYNPRSKYFYNYGGRNILMCDRWEKSFQYFYDDMIEGYKKGLEIDREDNSKGYSRDNCRWVTRKINNRNTRRNRMITYQGETKCLSEWCEILGLKYHTILARIYRGWTVEKSFIK